MKKNNNNNNFVKRHNQLCFSEKTGYSVYEGFKVMEPEQFNLFEGTTLTS